MAPAASQAAALVSPLSLDAGSRPNVLLLMPDQWRWDWDGQTHPNAGEAPPLQLPTIQQLREQGSVFSRGAVVPAPVCVPSRTAMASLREYDRAATPTNDFDFDVEKMTTYFSLLQQAGYHTMSAGKDDLTKHTVLGHTIGQISTDKYDTYHAKELGFSDSVRFAGKKDALSPGKRDSHPIEPFGFFLKNTTVHLANGSATDAFSAHLECISGGENHKELCETSTFPAEVYDDDYCASQAVELLQRAPTDKPWFMWVNFPGPHPPFAVTTVMAQSVTGRKWPGPVDASYMLQQHTLCSNTTTIDRPSSAWTRCNYAAEMENLDRLFGQILEAANNRGNTIEKDTVVCFFSDHGEMLDDHMDKEKQFPWQGSINVPLVCAGPGIKAGANVDVPVATIDVGATVLDYAGALKLKHAHPEMTAMSFRGLLEGADPHKRNRSNVHSGLQSFHFDHKPPEKLTDQAEMNKALEKMSKKRSLSALSPTEFMVQSAEQEAHSYSFRLVVSEREGSVYKFVCCLGLCPGAPSSVGAPDADGYTRLLYDTIADPFDMHNLRDDKADLAEELSKQLPVAHGFDCRSAERKAEMAQGAKPTSADATADNGGESAGGQQP